MFNVHQRVHGPRRPYHGTIMRMVAAPRPESPGWSPSDHAVTNDGRSAHCTLGRFGTKLAPKPARESIADLPSFVTARLDGDHPGLSGRGAATIRALVRPAGAVDVGVV